MKKFKKLLNLPIIQRLTGILVLLILYALLYKILIPRITAFGCFDDCNNFLGGYFLLHGKMLFTQIFFNHAPFMAYLSAYVQEATHPQNLFELILRHRQFLLIFGLVSEVFIFLRFGPLVIPFAFVYELTKFYLFGDRFLAEGFIVYPLIYLLGLLFEKTKKIKISFLDAVFTGISVWFIVFMREPYIPLVLFLFICLLFGKANWTRKRIGLGIFLILSVITVLFHNVNELIFNVFTVNIFNIQTENATTGILGINIYKSFVYPVLIFFGGEWNFFRTIEIIIVSVFLFTNGWFIYKKQYLWVFLLWIVLGFANLRLIPAGHVFYDAFHFLPWYALTIFAVCLMLTTTGKWNKFITLFLWILFGTTIAYVGLAKGSYVHDRIDEQTEFITNYGNVLQVGNVVNALSRPTDSLFVDGFDDSIYFVAHRYSTYQYSWYTSLMPQVAKYRQARIQMFAKNPPDFYYGSCPKEKAPFYLLPAFVKQQYVRLYNLKSPSCLWVNKSKLPQISQKDWQRAGGSLYFQTPHAANL